MPDRPARLWRDLPADKRAQAAEAFWRDEQSPEIQLQQLEAALRDRDEKLAVVLSDRSALDDELTGAWRPIGVEGHDGQQADEVGERNPFQARNDRRQQQWNGQAKPSPKQAPRRDERAHHLARHFDAGQQALNHQIWRQRFQFRF